MIAATSEPMARAGAVCARLLLAAAFLVLPALAHAAELTLKPFKDELFAYPGIIASEDGGAYRVVDYSEARDIDRRDKVPERRVHAKYVSTGVRKMQQDLAPRCCRGHAHFRMSRTSRSPLGQR